MKGPPGSIPGQFVAFAVEPRIGLLELVSAKKKKKMQLHLQRDVAQFGIFELGIFISFPPSVNLLINT